MTQERRRVTTRRLIPSERLKYGLVAGNYIGGSTTTTALSPIWEGLSSIGEKEASTKFVDILRKVARLPFSGETPPPRRRETRSHPPLRPRPIPLARPPLRAPSVVAAASGAAPPVSAAVLSFHSSRSRRCAAKAAPFPSPGFLLTKSRSSGGGAAASEGGDLDLRGRGRAARGRGARGRGGVQALPSSRKR
uniref:Uncharacterized protein n=1 Tax=Setaria viridis TaxID=4556 RepID=A0A4U6VJF8_SETVI|nr:hypothetical protein SEVIR_3G418700v2 [Setaria viridis]